jgi:hypothetical protein
MNNYKINIKISNAYLNDIIIINKYRFQLGYHFFPFININMIKSYINDINSSNIINTNVHFNSLLNLQFINMEDKDDKDMIKEKITDIELAINPILCSFFDLIILKKNNLLSKDQFKIYSNFVNNLIGHFINLSKKNINNLDNIIENIAQLNKKTVGLFNTFDINHSYRIIVNEDIPLDYDYEIINNHMMQLINNYIIITDCYLIFKSMTFMMISSKKYIIRAFNLHVFDFLKNIPFFSSSLNPLK